MTETSKNSETSKRIRSWWSKNWFYITLVLVAVIGGGCAFTLPYYFQREGDNIWSLRQAILAATGGVLAILTLWENRRKNIQEKEKNDQDHTRQVHAERRARYAKAIEQLADDKSAIRLGGVYTLAKLVDDWLDDEKTLPSMEKRRQEGQIIIDSLCAYIRSSFPLAERHDELTLSYEEYQQKYQDKNQVTQSVENSADNSTPKAKHQDNKQSSQSREEFVRDKSLFREEQEVRQTILSEIEKRLNGGEVKREDGKHEIKPGTWSYFEYDFLNTVFFYRVGFSNSYFGASSNFSGAKFTDFANFSGAKFTDFADVWSADFSGAEFTEFVDFSWAEFTGLVNFSRAKFIKGTDFYFSADFSRAKLVEADFSGAEFTGSVHFSGAEFTWNADFSGAEFTWNANFSGAEFTWNADFSEATFTQDADFSGATFTRANFSGAEFNQDVKAIFQVVSFSGTKFIRANFSGTEFILNADFSRTEFTQEANFSKATFQAEPIFKSTLGNEARFSCKADPEDYNFEVSPDSPYKIEIEEKECNGNKFTIPKGAILFDLDEPSE